MAILFNIIDIKIYMAQHKDFRATKRYKNLWYNINIYTYI